MAADPIDFWFTMGSTYSYLSVMRLGELERPVSLPVPYPAKQSIKANLVAIVGMRQGWGVDFVRAA